MSRIKTFTIGFTKKNANSFFSMLRDANAKTLLDVRLNNVSQLAGFAKRDDLEFFAREICNIKYVHVPDLAPTKKILDEYKKHKGDWNVYEKEFLQLMWDRNIHKILDKALFHESCLLCSEHDPVYCHRRLVLEFLQKQWDAEIEVKHLL
jgi:uncharacterized protein (DUF488 family)